MMTRLNKGVSVENVFQIQIIAYVFKRILELRIKDLRKMSPVSNKMCAFATSAL